ncbi:MAG: NAD(P)H-binding protein [Bacteroidales bacterium]
MQTILGAGGTVAQELAKSLTEYTKGIRLVSRNPEKVNPSDELFPTDLTIPHEVFKAVDGSDIVYITIGFEYKHSIWKELWPPFIQNTINACKTHNSKLVFFDNVYIYDKNHLENMTEESPVLPASKKGEIRAEVANELWKEIENGEIKGLIARSADFLGKRNSIPYEIIYKNLKKRKKAQWLIDDTKRHNFTYTKDAGKALALLGNSEEAYNHIWHLPTDSTPMTGKDWINLFAQEMNVKPRYTVISKWQIKFGGVFSTMLKELADVAYQFEKDYCFNSSRFEKHFEMKPTPPKQAVKEIINN